MAEQDGLTVKKNEDFSEWYTQVVVKAQLADYSAVHGCMVIRPHGYGIWENIQKIFNVRLKELGVKNAYFPLFIPESFFKKEASHVEGFKAEVAWIERKDDQEERVAVRPTSETIMYDSYSRWIRSWRDLPLLINQWANVVRWEIKQTKLFLRTREFLWQEGHTVHETEKECDEETMRMVHEYKEFCEKQLAIPVIAGKKTESEKFPGAVYTTTIESFTPEGKAAQCGTSHNLGQNFAKTFNITFLGRDEGMHFGYQTSWGFSTRLIGTLVMIHGDDKGLILPPRITPVHVVIVPIIFDKTKDAVLKKAQEVKAMLEGYDVVIDDRDNYSAGWKFNEWELKGVPIRIEIGPKDLDKDQVMMVRRDTGEKEAVKTLTVRDTVDSLLEDIQQNLFNKAKEFLEKSIVRPNNFTEFQKGIEERKFVFAFHCADETCEADIKNKTTATARVIPFEQENVQNASCIHCGKKAKYSVYFGKAY